MWNSIFDSWKKTIYRLYLCQYIPLAQCSVGTYYVIRCAHFENFLQFFSEREMSHYFSKALVPYDYYGRLLSGFDERRGSKNSGQQTQQFCYYIFLRKGGVILKRLPDILFKYYLQFLIKRE